MAVGLGAVDRFLAALEHPLKVEIERLRGIILGANDGITEQIKWKAPSFCFQGDDRVTMKLHLPDRIQLVFHRGAKVKDATGFAFADNSGLVTWAARDRGVVTLRNMAEIERHEAALRDLVNRWLTATSE